ncbi:MAG: galactose-1-phosphate uridylyltransferase, partial [Pseudomonadota bacterium]
MVQERRWQPLLEQWAIVAASSSGRPWSGAVAAAPANNQPLHDPDCYLCPRVVRANGKINPDYAEPFAFDNDFASLASPDADITYRDDELQRTASSAGVCRVLCWSQRHNATLATLSDSEMKRVARLWQSEYLTLSRQPGICNVLIFENKGTETGVSNLHPHGQIYATSFVTETAERMRRSQHAYHNRHQRSLLQDLIARDEYNADLRVEKSHYFVTVVPFAARFAYETWIIPTRHVGSVGDMSVEELDDLALMYQRQAQRYDRLFARPSPNVTLLHNAPCDDDLANRDWCFHIAMQPPLRDPDKLKYLAGFESGSSNIINPVPPEVAASQLRQCDEASDTSAL